MKRTREVSTVANTFSLREKVTATNKKHQILRVSDGEQHRSKDVVKETSLSLDKILTNKQLQCKEINPQIASTKSNVLFIHPPDLNELSVYLFEALIGIPKHHSSHVAPKGVKNS